MLKKILKKITPSFVLDFYHFFLSFFSSLIFGFPSKKITLIGITGTKGKTSVVELASFILEKSGYKTAFSSSLKFKIGEKIFDNDFKMTMPGRGLLQKFLKKAIKNNCQFALIEVTSEGILQFREKFLDFDVKVFLNLQKEHLERHKGFENYKKAKGKFFKEGKKTTNVINLDDENADYFLSFPSKKKVGFSFDKNNKLKEKVDEFIFLENYSLSEKGTKFKVNLFKKEFFSPLLGEFNLRNILASLAIVSLFNLDEEAIDRALREFKGTEGRFEIIRGKDFKVVLDYAHTPDSLKAVLKAIKEILKPNYLVCLIGSAGGGRDRWKRPEMAKIAEKYCQKIILANEDPYDEDPLKILEDIKKGFSEKADFLKILDREKAIKKGIEIAKEKKGVFAVFGKGGEKFMMIGEKKIPWSDKKIVLEEIGEKYEG